MKEQLKLVYVEPQLYMDGEGDDWVFRHDLCQQCNNTKEVLICTMTGQKYCLDCLEDVFDVIYE